MPTLTQNLIAAKDAYDRHAIAAGDNEVASWIGRNRNAFDLILMPLRSSSVYFVDQEKRRPNQQLHLHPKAA